MGPDADRTADSADGAHTPLYNWHKYWARKTWNVVGTFIDSYCPPSEVVLDPFAGSGVSGIEAVRQGRRAILVYIVPIMEELVWATLVDIPVASLRAAFDRVKINVAEPISELYRTTCPACNHSGGLGDIKCGSVAGSNPRA